MTLKLALPALLLFLSGLVALAFTTLFFFRSALPEATFPLLEFDANTPRVLTPSPPPGTEYRYMVYGLVDSHDSEPPESVITITASDGSTVETVPSQGYADLLGRYYKLLASFRPPDDQPVTITVEAAATDDFAVFYFIEDVLDHRAAKAMPFWITGFVLIAAAIGLLVLAVMKSEKGLHPSVS